MIEVSAPPAACYVSTIYCIYGTGMYVSDLVTARGVCLLLLIELTFTIMSRFTKERLQ